MRDPAGRPPHSREFECPARIDRDQTGRQTYDRPALRFFGTVRALTMGSGGTLQDGINNNKKPTGSSDRAVKHNIARIGDHPAGFGLYLFDYRPPFDAAYGRGRQFGVIADEVERVAPHAVAFDRAGVKVVNYHELGIIRGA